MRDISHRTQSRDAMLAAAQRKPQLMGIMNVTPDSFSDGGALPSLKAVQTRALQLVEDGADILDIGGESTRPGADPVSLEDELSRTIDTIGDIGGQVDVPLSIDTYKAEVARQAAEAGAVLINDVWGMSRDPDMADTVAQTGSAIVITYNRGAVDADIQLVDDARAFFDTAFARAAAAKIPRAHIWLDPGVGFGKTLSQNFEILQRLDVLQDYGCPVLVGLSRKSFIGLTLDREIDQRLPGSLAANLAAMQKGAQIFRVHDVRAHRDALTLFNAIAGPFHD